MDQLIKALNLEGPDYIALAASLVAFLSAIYSRWTWSEAKKANEISRINALLLLKQHYAELEKNEYVKSKIWLDGKENKNSDSYTEACSFSAANYQKKYREMSEQIEKIKPTILNSKT